MPGMFFICHSPRGSLNVTAATPKPVHVWAGDTMAEQAVSAGLIDWLIDWLMEKAA